MISMAIKSLYPNAEFVLENEDYSTIRWIVAPDPIPTLEELEAESARLTQVRISTEYQRSRKLEYPSLGDFADAYYWSQRGDDSKMAAWLAQVDAVKAKYPK